MFLNPDKTFSTFSQKGNLEQCDNAFKVVLNSASSVACSSPEGCVIMGHKKLKKLIVAEAYSKVFFVSPSIGVTYSGLQPDFRSQLGIAQKICQEYFDVYMKFPSIDVFINEFSLSMQELGQKSGFRPMGTFLTFVGQNGNKEPCCYQVDSSGSFSRQQIITAGSHYSDTKNYIERWIGCLDDNIATCLGALKEYTGANLSPEDVSIGVFKKETGLFRVYDLEDIREVFDSVKQE